MSDHLDFFSHCYVLVFRSCLLLGFISAQIDSVRIVADPVYWSLIHLMLESSTIFSIAIWMPSRALVYSLYFQLNPFDLAALRCYRMPDMRWTTSRILNALGKYNIICQASKPKPWHDTAHKHEQTCGANKQTNTNKKKYWIETSPERSAGNPFVGAL